MMQGSSPFVGTMQSPSYHSSSYLPKLEANFMKDFNCCGMILPSLHDLLQHYEEAHAQQLAPSGGLNKPFPTNFVSAAATNANKSNASGQTGKQTTRLPVTDVPDAPPASTATNRAPKADTPKPPSAASQEMEAVEDMEMDDIDNAGYEFAGNPAGYTISSSDDFAKQTGFATQAAGVPPLDLTAIQMGNRPAFQGMRQSQPTTPLGSGRPFHHNPTVSSVNTPTINANPQARFLQTTPDTSVPGTPAELDPEFLGDLSNMSMDNPSFMPNQPQDFQNFGFNGGNDLGDLCIDDPAKRLFRASGPSQQSQVHARLGNAQYGPDSEVAKTIRERQVKAGLADTVSNLPQGEEPKPFRCPVIGCEKAYKNQNGLKYHKSVSHNLNPA
jgi:transcription factor SFP1